jgi:hypothetical protein
LDDRVTAPWNSIFKIVFFPDRIFHAQYLNATRSLRYQYNVLDVRGRADFTVLKTEVYLDGQFLCNALRIEYRAGRLAEQARERGRLLSNEVLAWVELRHAHATPSGGAKRYVKMFFDRFVNAYQVEIWGTLEPPRNSADSFGAVSHDFKVLDQMGLHKPITFVPSFAPVLRDIRELLGVDISFRESDVDKPLNYVIDNVGWDNDYARSHQQPNRPEPNANENTILDFNYTVSFQRAFLRDAKAITPVQNSCCR